MTRGGDISDVTHKTPVENQHPGGQVGALHCWEGAPEPVWVSGGGGCARLCHFPSVPCSHPDIPGKSPGADAGAAGGHLAPPSPGLRAHLDTVVVALSLQQAWVHLQVPKLPSCGATHPLSTAGTALQLWLLAVKRESASPGWRELLVRKVCGFTAFLAWINPWAPWTV